MERRSFLAIGLGAFVAPFVVKKDKTPWVEFAKKYRAKTGKPSLFIGNGPGGSKWMTGLVGDSKAAGR